MDNFLQSISALRIDMQKVGYNGYQINYIIREFLLDKEITNLNRTEFMGLENHLRNYLQFAQKFKKATK